MYIMMMMMMMMVVLVVKMMVFQYLTRSIIGPLYISYMIMGHYSFS
jgi:hypothetical protein